MTATDPRLVELYDLDNPAGPDHDFFRALADNLGSHTIVDLGCGTGLLTVTLARPGRQVIGIDPDPGMLSLACRREGTEGVCWIHGDSRSIGHVDADLILMSGNVAQHVVGEAWPQTLADIHAGLRHRGTLAFESRNPGAQAWRQWGRESTYGSRDTPNGPLTEWMDVTNVEDDGTVTFEAHNVFEATGEHVVVQQTLAFRSRGKITADLAGAGLRVTAVWGGWRNEPPAADSSLMVFEAQRLDR
jgi:SAM-dependent methyltransferase